MNNPNFLNINFTDEDVREFNSDKISIQKGMNEIIADARKKSKENKCFYCGKPISSFCNSHFVPAFCLRNIALDGRVYYSNTFNKIPFLSVEKGVNQAGTFRLLCRDCDSKIFTEYENPSYYINIPTSKMIAQIAMKDYLKLIAKRLFEKTLFENIKDNHPQAKDICDYQKQGQELDLKEYQKAYEKARRLSKKDQNDGYGLFYYQKLNHVVPFAFQCAVALIYDLDGQIINNIYNMTPNYHLKELHICVFPLKKESIVMIFVDSSNKRYRAFCKQFGRLSSEDKLALTNYIIFLYSEDFFLSKSIVDEILKDKALQSVINQTPVAYSDTPFLNPIDGAKEVFDLNNWDLIPNLLSEEYKLA